MTKPRSRAEALRALIAYEQPVERLIAELGEFGWDSGVVLQTLSRDDLFRMLDGFIAGNIGPEQLEQWANLLECRDDVGYPEQDTELKSAVFRLANPYLEGEINVESVKNLRGELKAGGDAV